MPRYDRTLPPNPVLVLIGRQIQGALRRHPLRTKTALAAHLGLSRDTLTELLYGQRAPGAENDPTVRRALVRVVEALAPAIDQAKVLGMIDRPGADQVFPPTVGGAIAAALWQRRQSARWLARQLPAGQPTVLTWLHDTYRPSPEMAARLVTVLPELAGYPAFTQLQENPSHANHSGGSGTDPASGAV